MKLSLISQLDGSGPCHFFFQYFPLALKKLGIRQSTIGVSSWREGEENLASQVVSNDLELGTDVEVGCNAGRRAEITNHVETDRRRPMHRTQLRTRHVFHAGIRQIPPDGTARF